MNTGGRKSCGTSWMFELFQTTGFSGKWRRGDTRNQYVIQPFMKQPTEQEERNQDKKKPENENPSHGIDPESKEPEMEVERKLANG